MPRTARSAPGGVIFHVLNRGVGRRALFHKDEDYAAFEQVLEEVLRRVPMRLLAYSLMPDHWHLLLWPREEGDLGRFMQRLTITHTKRWQSRHHQSGWGHLYQGRFKSFPVQRDEHLLSVARYVERNALRAGRVRTAQAWRWSSLWRRENGSAQDRAVLRPWPVRRRGYLAWVNQPQSDAELAALRESVKKGKPFGDERWQKRMVQQLGLQSSLRPPGRPSKPPKTAGKRSGQRK